MGIISQYPGSCGEDWGGIISQCAGSCGEELGRGGPHEEEELGMGRPREEDELGMGVNWVQGSIDHVH